MKKLNSDLNKEIVTLFVTIMIALIATTFIFYLYFFNFYPVIVNGTLVVSRKIIRYGMYIIAFVFFILSVTRAAFADDKIRKLLAIKRKKIKMR